MGSTNDSVSAANAIAIANGNSLFSNALHGVLQQGGQDSNNLIFSPFSLCVILAMLKLGARGRTGQEIGDALYFPKNDKDLSSGFFHILDLLREEEQRPGVVLLTANRIFIQKGYNIKQDFLNSIQSTFGSEPGKQISETLDFAQSFAAANQINQWVDRVTKNKIKNLISPDYLDEYTRAVLVNGIYFKGIWKEKFDSRATRQAAFYVNAQQAMLVNMMYKLKKFPYAEIDELDSQVVSLPYEGGRFSMIIYLPRQRTGLQKLEQQLKNIFLPNILARMNQYREIEVKLPKFKIESSFVVNEHLKQLGITSMFAPWAADFSRIANEKLIVSKIVQKALIEVNEEGTEAAAASAGTLVPISLPPPPVPFNADHPFAFQIVYHTRARDSNLVLLAGRCAFP